MTREEFKNKIKSAIRYSDNSIRIYKDGRAILTKSELQKDADAYYQFRYADVARKIVLCNGYRMPVEDFLTTITNVYINLTNGIYGK